MMMLPLGARQIVEFRLVVVVDVLVLVVVVSMIAVVESPETLQRHAIA